MVSTEGIQVEHWKSLCIHTKKGKTECASITKSALGMPIGHSAMSHTGNISSGLLSYIGVTHPGEYNLQNTSQSLWDDYQHPVLHNVLGNLSHRMNYDWESFQINVFHRVCLRVQTLSDITNQLQSIAGQAKTHFKAFQNPPLSYWHWHLRWDLLGLYIYF